MIVPEYVPGTWHAVVAGGVVALLSPSTRPDLVRAVWDAVPADGGLADQLEVLLADGIVGLQPFALVDLTGGRVHAALRGQVEVEVRGADGTQVLSSGEVTTWSEQVVEGAREVVVRVTGLRWEPEAALPVLSGVVRAGVVRVELAAMDDAVRTVPESLLVVDDAPELVPELAPDPEPVIELAPDPEPVIELAPDRVVDVEPELLVDLDPELLVDLDPELVPELEPELLPELEPERASDLVTALRFDDGLVDHVPGSLRAGATPAVGVPTGQLLVADPVPPSSLGTVEDTGAPEDHDGLTILSSDLQSIRDQLPSWAGDEVPGPFRVMAPEVAPPAKLVFSTGQVVTLDRTVLLGRSPQVSRVPNRELPRLVTLPSPQQDISRTHAEVRAEGDDVLVTDLNSTNGLLVSRPGDRARRLHPGEATVIADGEVVDMGDGVTFTVERGA